ncbi:MAG: hypothetical protein KDK69_02180 [Chlamydiia bacterium]|nr:hypothetical protein [Chlamydiia bacterium]
MASGVSGPSGSDPNQSGIDGIPQIQTGIGESYTSDKAPGFKKWLEIWFPGQVTDQMVSAFEQNMMQMIQNSMKESQQQHQKVQQEIKERIDEQ